MEVFHHALKFKYDLCIGCSHCTSVCPTGAIHVEDGNPILNHNRCIDCGECYKICPVNAIYIEQDDFQTIYIGQIILKILWFYMPFIIWGSSMFMRWKKVWMC